MAYLLEIKDLTIGYNWENGFSTVVNHFNLSIEEGTIYGIAGESGSGKSTMAQAVYHSLKYPGEVKSGEVLYKGTDIFKLKPNELRKLRANEMSFVPQAAMNALNPVKRIGDQFGDIMIAHGKNPLKHMEEVSDVLSMVRLDPKIILDAYPHELSGGMRQRTVIAMALVLNPEFVILYEPTTGLDVLVEHDILVDLKRIQRNRKFSMLMITHDLSVLYEISDKIGMMYAGELTEFGSREDMLDNPAHPYNYLLLKSIPRIGQGRYEGIKLKGSPGNYEDNFSGCQFIKRCPYSVGECEITTPRLRLSEEKDHFTRCLRYPAFKNI